MGLESIQHSEETFQKNSKLANDFSMQILQFFCTTDPISETSFQHSLPSLFLNFCNFFIDTVALCQINNHMYDEVTMEIRHIKSVINLLFDKYELKQFSYKIPWQFKRVEIQTPNDDHLSLSLIDYNQTSYSSTKEYLPAIHSNKINVINSVHEYEKPNIKAPKWPHRCAYSQSDHVVKQLIHKHPHSTGEIIKKQSLLFKLNVENNLPEELENVRIAAITHSSSNLDSLRY